MLFLPLSFVVVTLILVFVVLMLIFVFVDFCCFFVLVVFLCCYVVKFGKANKKQKPKKSTPKKVEVLPGIFTRQVMVACAKVIVFFVGRFLVFLLAAQKYYKNRVFYDFEMLIFSFFGQKSRVNNLGHGRVNNLAIFSQNFAQKDGQVINSTFFTLFLLKPFFSKVSFSLQKEEDF